MKRLLTIIGVSFLLAGTVGCSTPLSTREKGAGIGALGGAAVGGIIGSAVGHPGAGAAIGGALGLGTGALVGDRRGICRLNGRESPRAAARPAAEGVVELSRRLFRRDVTDQQQRRDTAQEAGLVLADGVLPGHCLDRSLGAHRRVAVRRVPAVQ